MRHRIANVLRMEWAGMARRPSSLVYLVVIPIILIGQALLLSWLLPRFVNPSLVGVAASAETNLDMTDAFRLLILSQFQFFVLLIPAMIANVFATLSIVEEKMNRTLEPLLATPVRTWELLVGKISAGAVPALLVAWASTGLFILLATLLGWSPLFPYVLNATWVIALLLLMPAITLLSFVVGVIGSSRARDAQGAQNSAVFVALPILALIGLQVTGLVVFTPASSLLLSLGLIAIDVLLVRVAVRLFARESIVIRWR
ncbi:ABC transporter permease subunit [Candidatus Bipolaricaulota bacterium]|nr:ABC transporter permease subunit [Candidatus Bipolaricaulota bacterium]